MNEILFFLVLFELFICQIWSEFFPLSYKTKRKIPNSVGQVTFSKSRGKKNEVYQPGPLRRH